MDLGLRSKVALVTGASKGIGKAIAVELAREGASLAVCARGREMLQETEVLLSQLGARVVAGTVDVSNQEDVQAFVAKTVEAYGRIDVLVNNAGSVKAARFMDLTNADWKEQFDVHVLGAVNFCRAVIPHMQKQRWGRIVNVCAGLAVEPSHPLTIDYNAAKAALGNLSKALSTNLARDNILVNCVSPGPIMTTIHLEPGGFKDQTARLTGVTREEAMEASVKNVPLGRWGTPEELAAAVVFLASERAGYITGVNLVVDGGLRRSWV